LTDHGRYLGTYRWIDSHGRERELELFGAVSGGPGVQAYAPDRGAGRVLVAAMSADGRFSWDPGQASASGLDTTAARNDLAEICRRISPGSLPADR